MRPGVPYAGLELDYYDECMRTIPALAKMRAQGRQADVQAAVDGLMRTGADLKVPPLRRWSILTTAYMAWTQQLFEAAAKGQQEPVLPFLDRAIAAATTWAVRE